MHARHGHQPCNICKETFPCLRCIPCGHLFCLKCLEKYRKSNQSAGDELPCPTCRLPFRIPAAGFGDLPSTFSSSVHVEGSSVDWAIDTAEYCFEHTESIKTLPDGGINTPLVLASSYCVPCGQNLCDPCCAKHRMTRHTGTHKIVLFFEKEKEIALMYDWAAPTQCGRHENQRLEIYCKDCYEVLCVICHATGGHKEHVCWDLAATAGEFNELFEGDVRQLNRCKTEMRDELTELEAYKKALNAQTVDAGKKLDEIFERLKQTIDSFKRQMADELRNLAIDRLKAVGTRKQEIEDQTSSVELTRTRIGNLMERGSACDVSTRGKGLRDAVEKTMEQHRQGESGRLRRVLPNFTPGATRDVERAVRAMVGNIRMTGIYVVTGKRYLSSD